MKKITLVVFVMIFGCTANAQKRKKPDQTQNIDLIYRKIGTYTDSLFRHSNKLQACLSGYVFVQFQIDKAGSISSIITNKGTPKFLDSIFRQALIRTEKFWKPKMVSGNYFLPVKYSLRYNCPIDTSSKKYSALEWMLKQTPTLEQVNETRRTDLTSDFLNMINFDGKNAPIKAIILPPFQLVHPVISGHPY